MAYTKTDEELKEKVKAAITYKARHNLIFQWTREKVINSRQFDMLLDYFQELLEKEEYYDE